MSLTQPDFTRIANRLLGRLPPPLLDCLKPSLLRVPLEAGHRLFCAHEPIRALHFPESGVVSLVVTLKSGEALDVDVVGSDGVVGLPGLGRDDAMGCDAVVQVTGAALRADADAVRRLMASEEPVRELMGRFTHWMLRRSMQSAACLAFHPVKARCARWLLMTRDLVGCDDLPLTHDRLARLLGVRRASVTLELGLLETAGLITHSRGRVAVRNRIGLERASCECYAAIRDERERLFRS
jgi:CRP-like cAMP-binding protein